MCRAAVCPLSRNGHHRVSKLIVQLHHSNNGTVYYPPPPQNTLKHKSTLFSRQPDGNPLRLPAFMPINRSQFRWPLLSITLVWYLRLLSSALQRSTLNTHWKCPAGSPYGRHEWHDAPRPHGPPTHGHGAPTHANGWANGPDDAATSWPYGWAGPPTTTSQAWYGWSWAAVHGAPWVCTTLWQLHGATTPWHAGDAAATYGHEAVSFNELGWLVLGREGWGGGGRRSCCVLCGWCGRLDVSSRVMLGCAAVSCGD